MTRLYTLHRRMREPTMYGHFISVAEWETNTFPFSLSLPCRIGTLECSSKSIRLTPIKLDIDMTGRLARVNADTAILH